MDLPQVSIVEYQTSPGSLETALRHINTLGKLGSVKQVLLKPNLVGWDPDYPIAPYGVYTTSRLVEDTIILLKDHGIRDITIGEGAVRRSGAAPGNRLQGSWLIFNALGYDYLKKKYSARLVDFFDEPFVEVEFEDFSLGVARRALETEYVINMPVLKTHNQTVLSLGLKNLKGCIDLKSRRLCHHAAKPLDLFCSYFVEAIKPSLTILDGIYALEKGPYYLGTANRMNAVVASEDPLAVDMTGALLAGYEPVEIDHIAFYAGRNHRSLHPADYIFHGADPEKIKRFLKCDFDWRADNSGPRSWDRLGVSGIRVPKYDQSICTGCSSMFNPLLMLITSAFKGKPFEDIEVLSGKKMTPSAGFEKTILFGNCMIRKNRNHANIKEAVYIKGCPVSFTEITDQLKKNGLDVEPDYFRRFRESLAGRYTGKPEFEPGHFFMPGATGGPPIDG